MLRNTAERIYYSISVFYILRRPEFATILKHPAVAQVQKCYETCEDNFPLSQEKPPRRGVSTGRGCRRDPLGEARDCTLRRYGRSTFRESQAMVLKDLQIAHRVGD
jgi:hypothetical protein